MAQREILLIGDDRLRMKAKKVKRFDDSTHKIIDDMLDTMYAASGLGLAATQIGVPLRVVVIEMPAETDDEGNVTKAKETYILCNPEIIKMSGEEEIQEACLSVPGYMGNVVRATEAVVKAQDKNGRQVRFKGRDLLAQAFQHELDHLDGVLYVDRVATAEDLWRVQPDDDESGE